MADAQDETVGTTPKGPQRVWTGPEPAVLLVFDPANRLVTWSEAAAERPDLAQHLAVGRLLSALPGATPQARAVDHPLTGGGTVRVYRPTVERSGAPSDIPDSDDGPTNRSEEERMARARGRFFAAASHDLRQPLSALTLLAGALESRVRDPSGRDILKAMGSAVQAMKGLVESHLDLARLDAGTLRPDIGSVAVNGVLTRLAMEFAPRFEERHLRFAVQPCSAMIRSDRELLERVLRCLLANALRYTDQGRVLVGARRRAGELRLEVWDTGRGISPDERQTIEEEFTRPSQPGCLGGAGFGMGLTMAWRIAGLLGHRLDVRSQAGRGSMFAVVMPLVEPGDDIPEPAVTAAEPGPSDLARARVLVIDDDPLVLDALAVLLQQWGCVVTATASYEEAVARVTAGGPPPDLIVADFRLKGPANGIAAIRLIGQTLGDPVPGLILTGDTDPKRLREARLSGYPLLTKPVTPLALRTALARLLGRERLEP